MSKKQLQGTIISLATPKTAKVKVVRQWRHPLYKKQVRSNKNYACDYDEKLKLAVGEKVMIQECKPISKTKFFKVIKKVEVK